MSIETEARPDGGPMQAGAGDDNQVWFVGNATLLIRYRGITVLTDPNFVHRGAEVALGFGMTARRITDPGMDVEDIPQPDVVVVSHDHGDHFDDVAADWLDRGVPLVTTPGAAAHLEAKGFRAIRPLRTWETTELEKGGTGLRVTATPAQHAPGPLSMALPDGMGTMLEFWAGRDAMDRSSRPSRRSAEGPAAGRTGPRIYVSGDTVLHDGLLAIRDRFPEIDIAFVHVGGMRLMGMTVTLDADAGVELVKMLQPRLAFPIHYNDYATSTSPLADFVARVNGEGLGKRVRYLRHGESWPLDDPGISSSVTRDVSASQD